MLRKVEILSIPFTKGTKAQVLEEVKVWLSMDRIGRYIVTPNPEMIVSAFDNDMFKKALVSSDLSLADGVGVALAALVLGKSGLSRLPGVDLMEGLCQLASDMSSKHQEKPVTVGFLGGRGGVAERTGKCLVEKYPHLNIVFAGEVWGEEGFVFAKKNQESGIKNQEKKNNKEKNHDSRFMIHNSEEIDILFVAFGFPKQELWMYEHRGKIPVKVMMGVGGAFDYISGDIKRAPRFVRSVGLEWIFRLFVQPWRLKRQLALVKFIYLVFNARFFSR